MSSRRAPKGEYIETETGNKVARKAALLGTQNIILGGKTVIQPEVLIRGDLIRTIQASTQSATGAAPNNTAAASDRELLSTSAVKQSLANYAIIKDYVRILDGTVVPPNMVIPSFSIVAGQPARLIGEVPEGGHEAFVLRDLYKTVGNNPQPASS
ncbi:hypothetical protein VTH82DRAFT_5919 [Thermothelomyces myriococcoides]